MVEIKDISGKTRFSTPINNGAKGKFTLMKEDYIILPFSVPSPIPFKLGDYADLTGILDESLGGKLAKVYEITDLQKPTYNTSTGGYDYQLRLDAYYWKWKNKIFKYTPEKAGNEASWSLTASLDVHLGVVLRNLKALGYTYKGTEFTFSIDSTVEDKAVAITYDNINILDALFTLASKENYNCDCWITDNVIHFGRNEFGDAVKIERGVEASSITRSESQGTYATRIFAFGSTKNIPTNYRPTDEQAVINGVVQKRLMLPVDTPYIDAYEGMSQEEAIEDVVIFDDVFPRRVGELSDVHTRTEEVNNEDGTKETITYYRYKDTGLEFKEEYIIEGQELKIQFQSGKLNGMEFGVIFNPEPKDESRGMQLWEIVRNENYGRMLPDETMFPANGDKYILSGFDIQLVSDLYIPEAEQELKEKAVKYAQIAMKDDGTYPTTLRSSWVKEDLISRTFEFGQRINLVDDTYFENGRISRVLGWELKLDIPWDSPVYTIGESMPYSRIQEIEDKVDALTYKGQTYTGGGGSGVYIIRTNDSTAPSDSNVFSSLRSLVTFLRKDQADLTRFLIKFLAGLESGEYVEGGLKGSKLHKDGLAELARLQVNGDSEFRGNLSSRQFISGFPNGIGWALRMLKFLNAAGVEQEKAVGEVDDWIVRGKLRVFEFIISQLRGENDNVIFSGAMKVDHYDAETGRIYLDTEMGVTYNPFRFGDILMMQRFGGMPSEDNDYNVIKQYELRVEQVQVGSLSDGEDRLDWITFTNFVGDVSDIEEGDVLVRVDSVTDSTRKGIVKITTIDEFGAPYVDVVYGMKTDPANATKVRMGNLSGIRTKSGIDLIGLWGLYANGAYFENSTYILADGNTIEQKFSIMNGEFNSAIGQIKNNMSLEAGNILTNSTFSENTNYWESSGISIQLFAVNGQFIVADGNFLSEKKSSADICQDSGRNVLRLKNASVLQYNSIMNIPVHEDTETEEYTYSFRLYYKAITSGTLSAGIQGSNLYIEESLQPTEEYMVMSHVGKWNEEGNFIIKYTGEIYIYGVSLYNDALADAEIRLQTQITQNAEAIKLTATKEYVDSETEAIYVKYDAELKVTAEQISQRVTKSEFNAETEALERLLEGKITVQADRIDAAVIDIDKINNTIETAGWITTSQGNTLYAAKSLENGNTIVSYINQTATTVTINASKVNLKGAVTFTMFDSSLQNRLNNVESDASDALSSATQAYSKAVSATTSANNAQNDADQAIRDAAKAINDAATAISKAGSAQAAVNNLPEWSKEASIIKALESATVIVNGYIKTSMIDVDNLFCTSLAAVRGTIGGFTITETQMTAGTSTYSGIMRLSKDVLGFESTNVISRIGKYAISVTTGIICPLYLKNTSNSGGTSSNGACMILHVGRSAYSNTPQVWINCLHDTGSGSEFRVESRYLGDSSQKERTVINVGDFMSGNQLKSFQSSAQTFRRVLYNLETGYLCYDNNA